MFVLLHTTTHTYVPICTCYTKTMDNSSPSAGVLDPDTTKLVLSGILPFPTLPSETMSNDITTPSTSVIFKMEPEDAQSSISPPLQSVTNHRTSALTGTLCAVCGDVASRGTVFRRHYGVICCEACKCFFRRTVQMSRDYKCRYGNNCSIGRNADNLKQVCQACRFNQCILAGMKPESVKRFPKKGREDLNGSSTKRQGREKIKKGSSKTSNEENPEKSAVIKCASPTANGTHNHLSSIHSPSSRKSDNELQIGDTDLAHLKFNVSPPEAMLYLDSSTVPQLFNYDSLENIHEKSGGSPSKISVRSGGSNEDLSRSNSNPNLSHSSSGGLSMLATAPNSSGNTIEELTIMIKRAQAEGVHNPMYQQLGTLVGKHGFQSLSTSSGTLASKRQRLDSSSSAIALGSYHPVQHNPASLSAPHTPCAPNHHHPPSQPSSRLNSPEPGGIGSMYNSHNTTPYHTPLATPHATPTHTPIHSPQPSPSHTSHSRFHYNPTVANAPAFLHAPGGSCVATSSNLAPPQQGMLIAAASPPSAMNPLALPGFSPQNNILIQPQPSGGTLFLNPPSQMPIRVVSVTTPAPLIAPLVQFTTPFSHSSVSDRLGTTGTMFGSSHKSAMSSGKSPFTIVPIPSINKTQPDMLPRLITLETAGTQVVDSRSAPPSARSSPQPGKSKPLAELQEAELEEVLDSLRLRIRSLFTWAKSEVTGFEDLSPLDQKALLRRTVAEMVMLGFARASIAYDNMLLLGSTGKVIRPTNPNSGVASVASVTLQKLVVPLKVLNINDKELTLLKEIVLFNPESNGLRNREVVRQYRKRKHIELMEYTEKHSEDPGRFGDLMCLLTPLFEVSTEVTEQLRLEQFVHEGEARIDALLLMSMISGAEELPAESPLES